ncbi:MAG TPA: GNAT family N-acetyltransferase [Actinocrinis sp.]|jgi:GNAT superfamily N-acetyltransferase
MNSAESPGTGEISPQNVRLMQGLAQEVDALRPELANADATYGELAWTWGKGLADRGDTWRHRLWFDGGRVIGWGWIQLPFRLARTDGKDKEVGEASMAWQTHPERPEVLDEIIEWFDTEAPQADHIIISTAVNKDSHSRLAAHGYQFDEKDAGDTGHWHQYNARDLTDIDEPAPPPGFRFRTAGEVGPAAAVKAHQEAWYPSSFTERAFEGVRENWSYREDLHVLLEAPDGTHVASTIMWLDEQNRSAEFEPVGTHRDYRRQGLGTALLLHGMYKARAAGATRMTVACVGAPAFPAARGLYLGVGFHEFTRDAPFIKHGAGR